MKKLFTILVGVLVLSTSAHAVLSANNVYLLNNKMGPVANKVQLGSLLSGLESSTLGALADGKIWVGSALGAATEKTLSGDVTVSNAGVTAIGANKVLSSMIAAGEIVNSDINATAAIAYSKLAALPSAQILVGSAGNVATATAVTGDVTITNAGVTAIGAGKVTKAMLATAVAPSHVVKFAGSSAAEVDGDASVVITVTGALSTDVASVVLRAAANDVYVKKAVLTADTLTVTLSGNGGAGTVVDYVIHRAVP